MFNRILVPLDGSKLAERAVPHAALFARTFGGNITLLQVLDPSSSQESALITDPLNWQIRKAEAEVYLQATCENFHNQGVACDYALREGKTPENIVDFAQSENIDLLVLTTHGAGGLSRWNISSVVEKVVDKVYLPVLIVRAYQTESSLDNDPEARTKIDDETHAVHYRKILLPVDCSRRSECSLPAAIALAQDPQATTGMLVLAAVIKPPEIPIPKPYPTEINQMVEQFMQLSHDAVQTYLGDLQSRIPVETELQIVENESLSAAVHSLAENEDVDLVVLCAHGHAGRFNWPYGSVANHYLKHGIKPVLVVQDVPRSQVKPTVAETVAEKYGRR